LLLAFFCAIAQMFLCAHYNMVPASRQAPGSMPAL
jgi:hypothetical protein